MRTDDPHIAEEEQMGLYRTAERARDAIYSIPEAPPPDLILADIELGPGMNGLDFIEEVYRRETEASRKPIILMAYSSNPAPYMERIRRLQAAGIIRGAWNKKDFSYKVMVDEVNKILAETPFYGWMPENIRAEDGASLKPAFAQDVSSRGPAIFPEEDGRAIYSIATILGRLERRIVEKHVSKKGDVLTHEYMLDGTRVSDDKKLFGAKSPQDGVS